MFDLEKKMYKLKFEIALWCRVLTSGGSIARSTASDMIKNAIKSKNNPFTKPAITSALT